MALRNELEKVVVSLKNIPLHEDTVHLALSGPNGDLNSLVMLGEGIMIGKIYIMYTSSNVDLLLC